MTQLFLCAFHHVFFSNYLQLSQCVIVFSIVSSFLPLTLVSISGNITPLIILHLVFIFIFIFIDFIHPSICLTALAMDTVCCSITSWMAVRSASSILSNSSIQQIPMSGSERKKGSNRKESDRTEGANKKRENAHSTLA